MAPGKSNFIHKSWAVFRKDIQLEFRTRYVINAILMFALTVLTAVSFSIGPLRLRVEIGAALLWIILFFSAMSGLAHIFVREEEQETADTLRLFSRPVNIFLGKWLFNLLLLYSLEIIIVPLYFVFLNVPDPVLSIFIPVLFLGSFALASASTLIGAIISQASARGALFAVLTFPIVLPVMFSGIHGTQLAFARASFLDCLSDLQVLLSFSVVILTGSVLLFEFVWRK